MDTILSKAIHHVENSEVAFSKFITANDTGTTGSHQAGYHIHKDAWPLFFKDAGEKGENKDKFVTIRWQDDFETSSRFIYYGVGTRNEYRLTRFGRGFPFLTDDNIGDLLIIVKKSDDYYLAFVLQKDEDIEDFFTALNISSADTNGLIPRQFQHRAEKSLLDCFYKYIDKLIVEFPPTIELAENARKCYINSYGISTERIKTHPDYELLKWLNAEFQLFKTIEIERYTNRIHKPFNSVDELVKIANTILNRRKSRAGKSLEHHLNEIFNIYELSFSSQAVTEDNKKPDFIFPGIDQYMDPSFNENKLFMLAAKTTCKDRWRQILNEADRVKIKHLFTLQQGISKNQLQEMYKYGVCLVVPKPYIQNFPKEYRNKILSLSSFLDILKNYN